MNEVISIDDIRELELQVGPTLVAACACNRDRHIAAKWLNGTAVPTQLEARRLSFALEQFRRVAASEGANTARNWFIANNVAGGLTPFMAIREDNFDAVRTSAQRLIDGTDGY